MNKILKHKLEIIVFFSGATVMILELVGSRVVGPFLGSTLYVWTCLIGVIMGSLSLGYYWGGVVADKNPSYKNLSYILMLAGAAVFTLNFVKGAVLSSIAPLYTDPKIAALIISILLFSPPSILLGAVTPYAVKLGLTKLENSGAAVGRLYAISTSGSIFGTFLAGFFLISFLGTTNILTYLSITLVALSIFVFSNDRINTKLSLILLFLFGIFVYKQQRVIAEARGFVDLDTGYSRVWIYDSPNYKNKRPMRSLSLNNQNSSAIYLDNPDDLVFDYLQYYNLAKHFRPDLDSAVAFGGAAYTYPREFMRQFPHAKIDVVEIDPELVNLAVKYFNFELKPNLEIYHEDARTFLNKTTSKYDVAFMDAFNSDDTIPFHLTTVEATKKIYDALDEDGVLITNVIASFEGAQSGFLGAEYTTYKEVFPTVLVFRVNNSLSTELQNIVLIAFKNKSTEPILESADLEMDVMLKRVYLGELPNKGMLLTDDFAPVERFLMKSD